jgi:hypothetical protein
MANKPIKQYAQLTDENGVDVLSVGTNGPITTNHSDSSTGDLNHLTLQKQGNTRFQIGSNQGVGLTYQLSATGYGHNFITGSGGTVGGYTSLGAWTFGPTAGAAHELNGYMNFRRKGVTSGTAAAWQAYDGSDNLCGYLEINATANTCSLITSSDARLKTNHRDFDGLSLLSQMKPSKYERICNLGTDEFGFIAQDMHSIMPEAVSVGAEDVKEKPWGIDYGRITPVLVKAIQEQQAIIEDLKTRLAALEAK